MTEIDFIVPVALREVMEFLAPEFERTHGVRLRIVHMLNPEVPGHIAGGADWDIAITNPHHVGEIIAAGHAGAASCRPFLSTPLAFGRKGAHGAAERSVSGLTAILKAASSIALTDSGTSGGAFRTLARTLGIWDDIEDRLLYLEGGGPMRAILDGRAELATLPLSNIAPVEGVSAVAICPPELDARIDLSLCLSPTARPSALALAEWLLGEELDDRLDAWGGTRPGASRTPSSSGNRGET